jgi:hypothetical protein
MTTSSPGSPRERRKYAYENLLLIETNNFTYRQISKHMTRMRSILANSLREAFNNKYNLTEAAKEYLHASASAAERKSFAQAVAEHIKLAELEEEEFLDLVLSFVEEHWTNGDSDSVSTESIAWACFIVSQYSVRLEFSVR